ncbi:MAG: hypothetical protein L3J67_00940 [Hyphomicrobiaceae bacterium]|nr:hypothetical protein [Hyphomicrobiaceae bacterium]
MMPLGDLFAAETKEDAGTRFLNDHSSRGFSAWRDLCVGMVDATTDIPEQKVKDFIAGRVLLGDIDKIGTKIAISSFEIACKWQTDGASFSNEPAEDTDSWNGLLEAVRTELPHNLKLDILSDFLLNLRSDITLPDRVELAGECLGAVLDIEDNNKGDILKISMSLMKNGSGLFYPDPHAAYLKINNEDFREALDNVARACGLVRWDVEVGQVQKAASERDFDVRWSLYDLNDSHYYDKNGIGGPSLGGAMYTLCRALMEDAGKWPSENEETQPAKEA